MRKKPIQYELWKHFKGNTYLILAIALDADDSTIERVIYMDIKDRMIWDRKMNEFLDRVVCQDCWRFEKI